ncbi:tRNA adenosine(34) deaminase TadA [Pectinatus haikarae]|uniref:tRNA adenosine(34) deaminase TadA n=1 Tax=Pectinatus haikarae TaxID=349096 RepID=UPI001E4C6FFC|nr:tRNA adenosine(34) deaminase TadA [Pectinatus haikarae]
MPRSVDQKMMKLALSEADKAFFSDEVPVGAVIVDDKGQIIASAHNEQEHSKDATGHAEVTAIRIACAKLSCRRLVNMTLYVTLEPCPMCAGAILLSHIGRLVYGAPDSRMGAVESIFSVLSHPAIKNNIEIRGGVLEDECKLVLRKFFAVKRTGYKSREPFSL